MQTFLPYADFAASARSLDRARLGKQRVEAWQVMRALRGETRGWRSHPAVRMWRGFEPALAAYGYAMCVEWTERGYADSLGVRFLPLAGTDQMPSWLGDDAFHASHRSNLLRKDAAYYERFGWHEASDLPYVWPA